MLLPHESTVAHEQRFIMDAPIISRTKSSNPTASIVIDSPISIEESNKQTEVNILIHITIILNVITNKT